MVVHASRLHHQIDHIHDSILLNFLVAQITWYRRSCRVTSIMERPKAYAKHKGSTLMFRMAERNRAIVVSGCNPPKSGYLQSTCQLRSPHSLKYIMSVCSVISLHTFARNIPYMMQLSPCRSLKFLHSTHIIQLYNFRVSAYTFSMTKSWSRTRALSPRSRPRDSRPSPAWVPRRNRWHPAAESTMASETLPSAKVIPA